MQHAMEKIRGHKKPKVSVRVNVRPLRSNWKPVKIVEVGGQASSSPTKMSPAQEPLNANIWKNVRTDYVLDSKSSDEKSSELQTPSESTESSQNTTNSTFMPNSESQKVLVKEEEEKIPGLVKMCECENCRLLDATPTCVSPKRSDKMELLRERCKKKMMKGKMLEKREKKRKLARKNEKHRKPHCDTKSFRCSYSAPPNSVATLASQQRWVQIYEEVCNPVRPAEVPTGPSPLEVCDLKKEPSDIKEEMLEDMKTAIPSPQVLMPPEISGKSGSEVSDVNNESMQPIVDKLLKELEEAPVVPIILKTPSDEISPTTALSEDADNVSAFRRLEHLFYGSETNWWMFSALVMLTIFAYRSSMEQHTCYYD